MSRGFLPRRMRPYNYFREVKGVRRFGTVIDEASQKRGIDSGTRQGNPERVVMYSVIRCNAPGVFPCRVTPLFPFFFCRSRVLLRTRRVRRKTKRIKGEREWRQAEQRALRCSSKEKKPQQRADSSAWGADWAVTR